MTLAQQQLRLVSPLLISSQNYLMLSRALHLSLFDVLSCMLVADWHLSQIKLSSAKETWAVRMRDVERRQATALKIEDATGMLCIDHHVLLTISSM